MTYKIVLLVFYSYSYGWACSQACWYFCSLWAGAPRGRAVMQGAERNEQLAQECRVVPWHDFKMPIKAKYRGPPPKIQSLFHTKPRSLCWDHSKCSGPVARLRHICQSVSVWDISTSVNQSQNRKIHSKKNYKNFKLQQTALGNRNYLTQLKTSNNFERQKNHLFKEEGATECRVKIKISC